MIVGIVGKANVGKSTFFKALTLADILIANYPFATIKPNTGIGFVKIDCVDTFFKVQCQPREGFCVEHKRFVPVEVVDVAGLVPGAHEGKGMGNQFLDDLNQADVLIHVVDISGSTNDKGEPVPVGSHDPCADIRFLEVELNHWYLRILKKGWDKFSRSIQQEQKDIYQALAKQLSGLKIDEEWVKTSVKQIGLDEEAPASWSEEELWKLASALRERSKPILVAANKIDVPGAEKNLAKAKKEFSHYPIVGCSAESELALKEAAKNKLIMYVPGETSFTLQGEKLSLQQDQALEFIQKHVLAKNKGTGVQEVLNQAVFHVLEYIAVFPGGVNKLEDQHGRVLPDCFLVPKGSTALDFAFRIHTDLGETFIRAIDVKTKRTVGKEHVLNHLDVVEIVSAK